jgi:hypothetical protein
VNRLEQHRPDGRNESKAQKYQEWKGQQEGHEPIAAKLGPGGALLLWRQRHVYRRRGRTVHGTAGCRLGNNGVGHVDFPLRSKAGGEGPPPALSGHALSAAAIR